jgi:hypothetical protein
MSAPPKTVNVVGPATGCTGLFCFGARAPAPAATPSAASVAVPGVAYGTGAGAGLVPTSVPAAANAMGTAAGVGLTAAPPAAAAAAATHRSAMKNATSAVKKPKKTMRFRANVNIHRNIFGNTRANRNMINTKGVLKNNVGHKAAREKKPSEMTNEEINWGIQSSYLYNAAKANKVNKYNRRGAEAINDGSMKFFNRAVIREEILSHKRDSDIARVIAKILRDAHKKDFLIDSTKWKYDSKTDTIQVTYSLVEDKKTFLFGGKSTIPLEMEFKMNHLITLMFASDPIHSALYARKMASNAADKRIIYDEPTFLRAATLLITQNLEAYPDYEPLWASLKPLKVAGASKVFSMIIRNKKTGEEFDYEPALSSADLYRVYHDLIHYAELRDLKMVTERTRAARGLPPSTFTDA